MESHGSVTTTPLGFGAKDAAAAASKSPAAVMMGKLKEKMQNEKGAVFAPGQQGFELLKQGEELPVATFKPRTFYIVQRKQMGEGQIDLDYYDKGKKRGTFKLNGRWKPMGKTVFVAPEFVRHQEGPHLMKLSLPWCDAKWGFDGCQAKDGAGVVRTESRFKDGQIKGLVGEDNPDKFGDRYGHYTNSGFVKYGQMTINLKKDTQEKTNKFKNIINNWVVAERKHKEVWR